MPSQPVDTGWDFSSVIDLIESGSEDIRSPALRPATQHLTPDFQDGGIRLGSFSKLFESLGISDAPAVPLPPLDPDSELSNSDEAVLPSPTLKSSQTPAKGVEALAEDPTTIPALTKTQRKKARRRAEKELLEEQARQRVMQETLDQLAEEREQREHQARRDSPRKKSSDIVNESTEGAGVAEKPYTPCQPSRKNSRSNVGAKMRPATPVQVSVPEKAEAPHTQPKRPKTPRARSSPVKRPSTTQPVTPHPVQPTPVVISTIIPALDQVQHDAFDTSVPDQQIHSQPQRPSLVATPVHHGLIPRTVRPATMPRAASHNAVVARAPATPTPHAASFSGRRPPLVIRSKTDRHLHLFNKLMEKFPEDQKWLVAPMQLLNERPCDHGIHVFVDASNIMIGLKEMLRQHGLHHNAYDISFDSLALLMERRRPVAKRFFAGSHREAKPLPHIEKMVETSRAVGYDSVMQEQVLIVREESDKKKFFNDVKKMGWHKATQMRSGAGHGSGSGSGSGSDSETGAPRPKAAAAPKWVEQGVDEILHLKMCQSILDCEWPSTMVLATGDGAVAEMSDGFLAHVERALKRGWRVELLSWGQQINSGYRKRQFRAKWGEQFSIVELDEFLEDLIDTA